jgi:hypothetical protein
VTRAAIDLLALGAIAGIILVPLTGALVYLAFQARKRPDPTPDASIDRRRQLAEDAAEELSKARDIVDHIWLGLLQHGRSYYGRDGADAAQLELREAGEAIVHRRARIGAGFGKQSDTAEAFGDASDALIQIHRKLNTIRDLHSDPPIRGDRQAQEYVSELFDNDLEEVGDQRDRYHDASERFEGAAGRFGTARPAPRRAQLRSGDKADPGTGDGTV